MHPELLTLLARARRPEVGRVALNTNGLRLARDLDLCRRLADEGVYVVLSLDTLDPALSRQLHGRDVGDEKRRALDNLERCGVGTTLLMVLAAGLNEHELPLLLGLLRTRPAVRSLCIQTMTYTGQGGGAFGPRRHLPLDGVARRVEQASGGQLRQADFLPLPTAHPLCYAVSYLLLDDAGGVHSFAEAVGREALAAHLADGYLPHPTDELGAHLRLAVERRWSDGERPALQLAVKDLLEHLYPPGETLTVHQRQRRAEQRVKTVVLHAHMDEDTYELGRAVRCPDQVPVLAGDGGPRRLVPACNYNLFYRQRDERFWVRR
jgi:hypothetical protein